MKYLTVTVHYADEKTIEKYECSDIPSIDSDWITLHITDFAQQTINAKSVLKIESVFHD